MRLDIISIGQINKSGFNTIVAGNLSKVTVGAAIDIVHRDDMGTSLQAVDNSSGSG